MNNAGVKPTEKKENELAASLPRELKVDGQLCKKKKKKMKKKRKTIDINKDLINEIEKEMTNGS